MDEEITDPLIEYRDVLVENISMVRMTTTLMTHGVIKTGAKNRIEAENIEEKQVETMLDYIHRISIDSEKYNKFIEALKDTYQYGVVALLTGGGRHDLMERWERDILHKSRSLLVEKIYPEEFLQLLVHNLCKKGVLYNIHREHIMVPGITRDKRVEKLLDILPKRGSSAFDHLCNALKEMGKEGVAAELCFNHFDQDTKNYWTLMIHITGEGSKALRECLNTFLSNRYPGKSWDYILQRKSVQANINHKRIPGYIKKTIYPEDGLPSNLNDMDIPACWSLLKIVCKLELFSQFDTIPTTEDYTLEESIDVIRFMRNRLIHSNTKLDYADYEEKSEVVKRAINCVHQKMHTHKRSERRMKNKYDHSSQEAAMPNKKPKVTQRQNSRKDIREQLVIKTVQRLESFPGDSLDGKKDSNDAFGEYVARELKELKDPEAEFLAKQEIMAVLCKAKFRYATKKPEPLGGNPSDIAAMCDQKL